MNTLDAGVMVSSKLCLCGHKWSASDKCQLHDDISEGRRLEDEKSLWVSENVEETLLF